MSIVLRNFDARDFEGLRALASEQTGSEIVDSKAELLKQSMLADTTFSLVAENNSNVNGTVSILMQQETAETVVGLLGRLYVSDIPSRSDAAANLVGTALQSLYGNLQICFSEVLANDVLGQLACEQSGFVPCGYLPQKFQTKNRCAAIVYSFLTQHARDIRRTCPEIIVSAKELAVEVLRGHGMIEDIKVCDEIAAYPTECNFTFVPIDTDAVNIVMSGFGERQTEIFNSLQDTQTCLHLPNASTTYRAAKDHERVVGIIGYALDPFDKRVQITHLIALDHEIQGCLISHSIEFLGENFSADYWEVLVNAHAPRMQKTLDQVGFIPCAYLPAYGLEQGRRSDAIKMVKLNARYKNDGSEITGVSKKIFSIIDIIFREQSVGMAILKMLQSLRIFRSLGEGELRHVARLFSQKLFKPGEVIFEEGSTGRELYIVERGEIEIYTSDGKKLLGSIRSGMIFGEGAFLNGEPRMAKAISKSPTIVRIIHREDFDHLIQREIHLGLVFFQNVAIDLVHKLKQSNILLKDM